MGISLIADREAIFPDETVLENVCLAREAVRRESSMLRQIKEATEIVAWRMLIATNLKAKAQSRASSLSFLDQRWLSLAMALACDPVVFVFDEPFAGADEGEIRELADFIQALARKSAVVLTDRSIERMFALAGRISILARGRVVNEGSPHEILARAGGATGNA
jgi:branched-chain amino acid transport system ATP-binding protein